MKITSTLVVLSLLLLSCKTKNFNEHSGLVFKQIDWESNLERPYLINSDVIPELGDTQFKLYLPAELFNNTTITSVFYRNMKSQNIEVLNDEKNRILVLFDKEKDTIKNTPYDLSPDESVVVLEVNDYQKIIKLEDIRVPFYDKENAKP
jgi:hypothetical protein